MSEFDDLIPERDWRDFASEERLLTPDEVARMLSVSSKTIHRAIRTGRLEAYRLKTDENLGPIRISRSALRSYARRVVA